VPVKGFFDYIKGGHTVDEFVGDFLFVTHRQALALLNFVQSTISITDNFDVQIAT
jgi:hypothetical protein